MEFINFFLTFNVSSGIVASQIVASQWRTFLKVAAQVGYIFVVLLDYIYIKAKMSISRKRSTRHPPAVFYGKSLSLPKVTTKKFYPNKQRIYSTLKDKSFRI